MKTFFFLIVVVIFASCSSEKRGDDISNPAIDITSRNEEFNEVLGNWTNIKLGTDDHFLRAYHSSDWNVPFTCLIKLKMDSLSYTRFITQAKLITYNESKDDPIFRENVMYNKSNYRDRFWSFNISKESKNDINRSKSDSLSWWDFSIADSTNIHAAFYILDKKGKVGSVVKTPMSYTDGRIVSVYNKGFAYILIETDATGNLILGG